MEASFDEQLIERYVRRGSSLSVRERQAAEALLARSPAAREIAGLFSAFYEALAGLEAEQAPAVAAFLDRLFPPARIIVLHPYQALGESETSEGTVLAAKTSGSPRGFETLATLASPEDHVLVRLLWNHAAHQGRLYAMAGEPEKRAHALVTFPDLDLHLVTDEHGRADVALTPEQVQADWVSARATLRLPLAVCSLKAEHLARGRHTKRLSSGHEVTCAYEEHTLRLAVRLEEEAAPPSFAVLDMAHQQVLMPLREGAGRSSLDVLPEHLTIRLYP